jgi:hypothetical protein
VFSNILEVHATSIFKASVEKNDMLVNIYQTAPITSQKTLIFIVTAIRTSCVTVEGKKETFALYSDDKELNFRPSDPNIIRPPGHTVVQVRK